LSTSNSDPGPVGAPERGGWASVRRTGACCRGAAAADRKQGRGAGLHAALLLAHWARTARCNPQVCIGLRAAVRKDDAGNNVRLLKIDLKR
jgi:hypothetical protein